MENKDSVSREPEFKLLSTPDVQGELFVRSVLEDIARPQVKRPLQCVTIKMPLPAYLRMKKAAQRWNLTYTDLINSSTELVVPILESPSGDVAQMLEQHRADVEQRRKAARTVKSKLSRFA